MPDSEPPGSAGFRLPAVDDPPSTETGVILMGLAAEQLLAGLGVAALADDPVAVTLLVDHVRHGARTRVGMDQLIAAGLRRWQIARTTMPQVPIEVSEGASPRHQWARAYQALGRGGLGPQMGPATAAYLTACWLRAAEIDRHAEALGLR
jgi:Family of unknown function (DUF6187)